MVASIQDRVREAALEAIENGLEIGLQVVAYRDGEKIVDVAEGLADPAGGRPVDHDTLFNVFSVTKAVSIIALHILADRGVIAYEDRVADLWPEYGENGKAETTIRHVLTHRSGVPQMPEGLRVENLADWDLMTRRIAALEPIAEPGSKALYQPWTHGWLVGEIVRRADPRGRSFAQFVREEIAEPLDAPDLWIGLPASESPRVARLFEHDGEPPDPPPLYRAAIPENLRLSPPVFELDVVRRAVLPSVGGVFTARSCARFWAMLAQGGELGGARILSRALAETLADPLPPVPDLVMYGQMLPLSQAGFWLGMRKGTTSTARKAHVLCHPGAGNSFAWADPRARLAVAFCHNRMYHPMSRETDGIRAVSDALRDACGLTQ